MSKGFPGIPGNMQALVKQAQKMQQDLAKAQEEAQSLTAEGSSGGGMVKVVVTGKMQIESITINPEVVNKDDIEMLQDLVKAATNDALTRVQESTRAAVGKVTGGMNLPGLF